MRMLQVLGVRMAKTTYPTGNPNFAVKQAFPAGFDEVESDPFLMCDFFGPSKSTGKETNPDKFQVGWHPHRGMDICTYMKEGVGRHADSLGNREEYATPGMQWISVGSGIEHAEGGGTPAGENTTGFQLWINVPAKHKMDDPQYGTIEPCDFPLVTYENSITARILAGLVDSTKGPFLTKQPLQMVDFTLPSHTSHTHIIPPELDNCLIYVYEGSGHVNSQLVHTHNVLRLDAKPQADQDPSDRKVIFQAGAKGLSAMLFAGKRINEEITWHGPFVMNTQDQIQQTFQELRQGNFPPRRVPWDYKSISAFPAGYLEQRHEELQQQKQAKLQSRASATVSATGDVTSIASNKDQSQCL